MKFQIAIGFNIPMARRTRRTYPDLKTYFAETGETQLEFARRYQRSQNWVSKVVNGQIEPAIRVALRISRETGVPLESLACRPDICAEAS
ncbi:MAG TPA: helix-turn-helix transcriptional regulator [Vicinamibacterales bacterium]|nr:helix-turn-helix transcriptional regulator [Vicinamibacterales bacterium]